MTSGVVYSVLLYAITMGAVGLFMIKSVSRIVMNSNSHKEIKDISKALLKTLQETNEISPIAKLLTAENGLKTCVELSLSNSSVYEQNVFNTAVTELFST